jgi:hypothetical protein
MRHNKSSEVKNELQKKLSSRKDLMERKKKHKKRRTQNLLLQ